MKTIYRKALIIITLTAFGFGANAQNYQWAKGMGSISNDEGKSMAIDGAGNVYTVGVFYGTADFDPGVGAAPLVSAGWYDIFISKLDVNGNFVWAKSMGGTSFDVGSSIAIDATGNIYITGYFQDTVDFDPGSGTTNLISKGGKDIFISKLDTAGNFIWAKNMGGFGDDEGTSMVIDGAGNVYSTGYFESSADFDPGVGTTNLASAGRQDIFISKLNAAGNFVWAKRMGGTKYDEGASVTLDTSGNVCFTGYFEDTVDFDPGAGTTNLTSVGGRDIFISKLDATGNLVWAKSIGTTGQDYGNSIAVDASGNIYATGSFHGTADFDPGVGTTNLTSAGYGDIFISKLDASGNYVWAKAMGGANSEAGYSIALDGAGNVYTTGSFSSNVDFDPGTGRTSLNPVGGYDMFIQKLNAAGNFVWAKNIGGTSNDIGYYIALDGAGNIYTTGTYRTVVDFNPGAGTANLYSAGTTSDVFILKLSQSTIGINEQTNNINLSIYPNPVNNQFTIEIEEEIVSFKIIDILGKTVKNVILTNNKTIDVSDLVKGIYILYVQTDKGFVSKKIIKK